MRFDMPVVQIGQIVLWHPDTANPAEACPAIVTRVFTDSVSLSVLRHDRNFLEPIDGVRHKDDPQTHRLELRDYGGWSHTSATLETQKLQGDMDALFIQMQKLREDVNALGELLGNDVVDSVTVTQ